MVFGDIPARRRPWTLITGMFLHGDLFHLLFNMWFLWLVGCNMEDRWGRVPFGLMYLGFGTLSGLSNWVVSNAQDVPVIGASGAIAGVMGAFLHARAGARAAMEETLAELLRDFPGTRSRLAS